MKKKFLAIGLVVAMAATAVVGGTLAYFTDTDQETNTFTAGGVKIDLIEQQVNDEGTALEGFEQNQVLMPIVGSAKGDKDDFGQPIAENYIDKIVTIKNTGNSDAYVRAYFAIPSALDDGYDTFNAGLNILHFNFGNKDNGAVSTYENEWIWHNDSGTWKYYETTIDGVSYNVYYADYYTTLAAGGITEQFLSGVYLDKDVDINEDGQYFVKRTDKETGDVTTTVIEGFDGSAKCPVYAVAVQAAGFDSVDAAVNAAFGANFNPFGGEATNWQS